MTPVSAIRRIALVPALLVLFAFLEGCAEEPRPAPSHIPSVKTQVVRTESSLGVRIISAVVQADKTATLAFPIGGTVAQILVDLGDAVSKGQTLARIDPRRSR